ncbi:hypothetical protein C6500_00330 [Candidatus Poribacteria bacterium]|nr:MAG: hypothetical protein C6500_00330 [Candidatus Poribacteria bacterium]
MTSLLNFGTLRLISGSSESSSSGGSTSVFVLTRFTQLQSNDIKTKMKVALAPRCFVRCTLLIVLCTWTSSLFAAYEFDTENELLSDTSSLKSWHDTILRGQEQDEVISRCLKQKDTCPRYLRSLRVILEKSIDLEADQKVKLVNQYVNRFRRYKNDKQFTYTNELGKVYVRQDWVTVSEFLRGGGDCEDYATTKYQILRRLGFAPDDLRIVIAFDLFEREYHAILAVRYEDGRSVILDTDNRIYRKKPTRYKYVYAVNEEYVWDHNIASVRIPRRHINQRRQVSDR